MQAKEKIRSAFFITFNGNCKRALTLYQSCFGGTLNFKNLAQSMGLKETPVVSGCLVSEGIIIYGSDLVHDEGRRTGNHMAFYVHCDSVEERVSLIKKLDEGKQYSTYETLGRQKLIEIIDGVGVVWIFGI